MLGDVWWPTLVSGVSETSSQARRAPSPFFWLGRGDDPADCRFFIHPARWVTSGKSRRQSRTMARAQSMSSV